MLYLEIDVRRGRWRLDVVVEREHRCERCATPTPVDTAMPARSSIYMFSSPSLGQALEQSDAPCSGLWHSYLWSRMHVSTVPSDPTHCAPCSRIPPTPIFTGGGANGGCANRATQYICAHSEGASGGSGGEEDVASPGRHPRRGEHHAVNCALCYSLHAGRLNLCERDGCARSYCSATCRNSDWKSHGHNHWCGKSAERDTGYQISDAGVGRGEGVFALQEFVAGDRIMVERASLTAAFETPVGSAPLLSLPTGVKAALSCLSSAVSEDATAAVSDELAAAKLQRKFTNNAICLGDADRSSGLFLTIAKVNHACAGNSEHYYLAEHGLMLLVATTNIAAGDEITFSYVHDCATKQQRAANLQHWGIVCDCRACVVRPGGATSVCDTLDKIARLDAKLVSQGSRGHISKALTTGHRLLELYERSGLGSLMLSSRTNFDMFGLAALEPSMRAEARQFLRNSCRLDACFFGRSDLDICQSKRALLAQVASSGEESGLESESGEAGSSGGGSVDDGRTSDEEDWPRVCAATVMQRMESSAIDRAAASHVLAARMADDGAAMICQVLPPDACAAARGALLHLRDEGQMSHLFSSPTSNHAPPCAAECVWLCDAAFAAMAHYDGACGGDRSSGASAIRCAVDACAAEARRALVTLGYDPADVCQLGLPMAAVGVEPALAERFHCGHEGAPALHHRPMDGLDAKGSRPSELILTSTLILHGSGGSDHGLGGKGAPWTADGAMGGSSSAVDDVTARVAVLRTHAAPRMPAAAGTAGSKPGSKRRRGEDAAAKGEDADDQSVHLAGPSVREMSFHPEVGDLLLIHPHTSRSLSGDRVSITLWWQLANAAADQPADVLSAVGITAAAGTTAGDATATVYVPHMPPTATVDLSNITPKAASTTDAVSANTNHASASAPAIGAKSSTGGTPEVYDGILSRSVREALCAMPPVRFGIYDRSCSPCNAHEQLIGSLLEQLGDDSRYIEYWGRAVWQAVPAHSDLDEIPLLAPLLPGGEPPHPRFPLWAHVVYLDIADGVAAPTVLWDDGHSRSRHVIVVPAVASRLLRFSGSWVHAVPKPAAEHLGEEQTEGDEVAEEARGGVLRHVLLFNSWPDAPPVGQPSRPAAEVSEMAADTTANALEQSAAKAAPFEQWRPSLILRPGAARDGTSAVIPAAQDAQSPTTAFVARLMGGPRRRGRSERYRCDALTASRDAVYDALYESMAPSSFCVQ